MSLPPDSYVLGLEDIDQTQVAVVGGKGAQLGELSRIEGNGVQCPIRRNVDQVPRGVARRLPCRGGRGG